MGLSNEAFTVPDLWPEAIAFSRMLMHLPRFTSQSGESTPYLHKSASFICSRYREVNGEFITLIEPDLRACNVQVAFAPR